MQTSADFQHDLQCRTLCAVVGGAEAVRALQLLSAGGGARNGGVLAESLDTCSDSLAADCEPWENQLRGLESFLEVMILQPTRQEHSTRQTESFLSHNNTHSR
jgi:hypothetical protein